MTPPVQMHFEGQGQNPNYDEPQFELELLPGGVESGMDDD